MPFPSGMIAPRTNVRCLGMEHFGNYSDNKGAYRTYAYETDNHFVKPVVRRTMKKAGISRLSLFK